MESASADIAAEVPPIPTRGHQSYHQHSKSQHRNQHPSQHHNTSKEPLPPLPPPLDHPPRRSSRQPPPLHIDTRRRPAPGGAAGGRASIAPTSPEVISNLITSLSVISEPASNHFEGHPTIAASLPASATPANGAAAKSSGAAAVGVPTGSFGVDYGAFAQPHPQAARQDPTSLDELAASPPVIRTSKPTSGYSPLAPPNVPRSPKSPSREGSGLKSFIRNSTSRPSSKGSLGSRNDDTRSIGNLSVERGSAATPELRSRGSHDSWGKKTSRSQKGVMYMSSRERLREQDSEKKRSSFSTPGTSSSGGAGPADTGKSTAGEPASSVAAAASSNPSTVKPDQFLAWTAISEEPTTNGEGHSGDRAMDGQRPIPARDSSLRRSSSNNAKRSSARRSKRNSDGHADNAIPEAEEPARKHDTSRRKHDRPDSDLTLSGKSFLLGAEELFANGRTTASASRQVYESSRVEEFRVAGQADELEEDGAPFPAVAQGRRRDDGSAERSGKRLSGRQSPGPNEGIKSKRSSSRLKRLSNPLNPRGGDEPQRDTSMDQTQPVNMRTSYDRPVSADSVDDAVESYLCSPRLSQKIRHPQTGRVISFSEVGDADGSAVFCCVGMGLTRYITAFYDELALTLKLRLITPDRPGVGDSEPYSDGTATPLSWPDDIYAICQALKITKFSILAHSAGAIYALATALRMPQHIRGRIHLLAPWIPPSQMNVFGATQTLPPTNSIPTSQRILRALPTPILKAANSSFMTATSSSITSSLPKTPRRGKKKSTAHIRETAAAQQQRPPVPSLDKENFGQGAYAKHERPAQNGDRRNDAHAAKGDLDHDRKPPSSNNMRSDEIAVLAAAAGAIADKERQTTYDTRLTQAIWELATTNANPAVDLLVCLERRHTIGFRYMDITRPVVIHHGSRDTRVPVENVKWLGKTMRRCEVRVLEGEGHGLMASAGVMAAVLMEMSKEWEDWIRVTSTEGRKERERGRRGTLVR